MIDRALRESWAAALDQILASNSLGKNNEELLGDLGIDATDFADVATMIWNESVLTGVRKGVDPLITILDYAAGAFLAGIQWEQSREQSRVG